jgi:hypothetical protein
MLFQNIFFQKISGVCSKYRYFMQKMDHEIKWQLFAEKIGNSIYEIDPGLDDFFRYNFFTKNIPKLFSMKARWITFQLFVTFSISLKENSARRYSLEIWACLFVYILKFFVFFVYSQSFRIACFYKYAFPSCHTV